MKELTIIGAGGHGKVVADTAEAVGYTDIVFLDQRYPKLTQNGPWPVVGNSNSSKTGRCFLGVGSNATREKLTRELNLTNAPTLVHPAAVVSRYAQTEQGVLVVAGSVVNVNATIGKGAIINTSATVDHDCIIGAFVHISPGAHLAGGVVVGARSWIGAGSIVKEGVKIGSDVIIGAGAVVINDIPDKQIVVGNPAKPIREKQC